jgi:alcohol dehydrogenase class IV
VKWVSDLVSALNIPALSAYGMSAKDIPSAVEKTMKASSTRGNPILLTEAELASILEWAV